LRPQATSYYNQAALEEILWNVAAKEGKGMKEEAYIWKRGEGEKCVLS
jgi:hypothetical protein